MPVPAYSELMLPLLQYAGDEKEHHIRDAMQPIADYLGLSDEDISEFSGNGSETKFSYRLRWAKTYLKKAGLIEATGRGLFQITERGIRILSAQPTEITNELLMQFPEFVDFKSRSHRKEANDEPIQDSKEETPKEVMRNLYVDIHQDLADELLEYVMGMSPAFFEKLVIDLLLAMGYGGTLSNAGQTIGRSGDGGIDGYIQEDKLGLSMIYVQAKRWSSGNNVQRPDVQAFVGSLMGVGATKGVFITTSHFSQGAKDYANSVQNLKVVLIDGIQLTQLMIEHNVGVSAEQTFVIKRVDTDYFDIA